MPDGVDLSAYLPQDDGGDNSNPGGFEPANPAWKEFVGEAPKDIYEKYLEPAYSKWDQHVNKRFEEHNQTYGPWKDFVKSTDPQTASFAVNLVNALHSNPVEYLPKLQEYYSSVEGGGHKFNSGQGQPEPVTEEDPYAQKFSQMERTVQLLRDALVAQRDENVGKEAEVWLDSELKRLQKENEQRGPFNERWVLALAANTGGNAEALKNAVEEYYSMAGEIAKTSRTKPMILSNGGGAPSGERIHPRKMESKEVNSLIVDILNGNNAARNG